VNRTGCRKVTRAIVEEKISEENGGELASPEDQIGFDLRPGIFQHGTNVGGYATLGSARQGERRTRKG